MQIKLSITHLNIFLFAWIIGCGFPICQAQSIGDHNPKFHHNYSQTLVMKIMNATVNKDGSSNVVCNFETTLGLIKKVDAMTIGVPKIIYLTGWQYNGHDDRYPAFFEVNSHLKRGQDSTALQSLNWLIKEARKYHTTVSLHINMTDAYKNSPLWQDYVDKNMISKNADGSLKVIGHYNQLDSYQINYKHEWEQGYAQYRIDKLLELLPILKTVGTIHLDAWFARNSEGDCESNVVESEYQKKICSYWNSKGIDVTSEAVLDYMVGMVPYAYHFYKVNQEFYMKVPATTYTGSDFNPDVPSDVGLGFLFGISMNAESIFPYSWVKVFGSKWYLPSDKEVIPAGNWDDFRIKYWTKIFMNEFYLHCPQYFFLNKLKRKSVIGTGNNRVASFSEKVKVSLVDSTVYQDDIRLREKNLVFFPAAWVNNTSYILYTPERKIVQLKLPKQWQGANIIRVKEVTENGLEAKGHIQVKNGLIEIIAEGNKPLLLDRMD